jgi:hypothetical protein
MSKYLYPNIGKTDRVIRVIIAVALFISVGLVEDIILQRVLFVLSIITLFTVVTGWCGLYSLFKISTK